MEPRAGPEAGTLILRAWSEGGRFHARAFAVSGYGPPQAGLPNSTTAFADREQLLAYVWEWLQQIASLPAEDTGRDRPLPGP